MRSTLRRHAARTVLMVGEGDAEVALLQHLKRLYVQRGSGVAVTIKNARGKGAAHVVEFARRQSINAAYDVVAALLDTDTDWNDKTRAFARQARVHVVTCDPCLEAALLTVHLASVEGRLTAQLKQDFATRFGGSASQSAVLRHFPREVIEAAWLGRLRCAVGSTCSKTLKY
jgi:hypothetical protein